MPTYGVIDLGSNSIRMVIYDVKDDRKDTYCGKDFKSIINDKVMAGLAAFVVDGVFTQAGIDRAVNVLRGHAKRARYFGCARLDVFATAVLRNAKNCDKAVAAIEKGCGLPIALLSARDEAHLGFVGAGLDRELGRATLIDIGGGSTELSRVEGARDAQGVSIGQGSLSSFADHVASVVPTPAELDAIERAFRARLEALGDLAPYRAKALLGVGGSVRAAAKMLAQMNGAALRPKTITADDVRAILELCRDHPDRFAHTALKASAERVHTLAPGCVILHALFDELGAAQLSICKYGVREGYLVSRMLAR